MSIHSSLAAVLCIGAVSTGCSRTTYTLMQAGTISYRAPYAGRVPAMVVIDDTTYSRQPCGHATNFTLAPDIRVLNDNGTRTDTSALTVGRRVSVFIIEGSFVALSSPPIAEAAKVVIY